MIPEAGKLYLLRFIPWIASILMVLENTLDRSRWCRHERMEKFWKEPQAKTKKLLTLLSKTKFETPVHS
jgi:Zn-finger domain-containing protein